MPSPTGDLLVPLYRLPPRDGHDRRMHEAGVVVRRAYPMDLSIARRFAGEFGEGWVDELTVAFSHQPNGCFLALKGGKVVGFACIDVTARGFFGPLGVSTAHRGHGIGGALLIAGLYGLRDLGFAYAIIGWAGPIEFYQQLVAAFPIPDSAPGSYLDLAERPQ